MIIDEELVAYLEDLSCLVFSEEEKQRLTGDLNNILGLMAKLGELDTEGIPESSHPFDNVNNFRNDEVQASFSRELILSNAPEKNDGMFVVPKTVE